MSARFAVNFVVLLLGARGILMEVNLGGVPSDPRIADSVQHAHDARASADAAVAAHNCAQKRITA